MNNELYTCSQNWLVFVTHHQVDGANFVVQPMEGFQTHKEALAGVSGVSADDPTPQHPTSPHTVRPPNLLTLTSLATQHKTASLAIELITRRMPRRMNLKYCGKMFGF